MPECPRKLTEKLPDLAMRSAIIADDILSISMPPYSSGTSTELMPSSLAFLISSRVRAKSLCSILSIFGTISLFAKSSVVCAMS